MLKLSLDASRGADRFWRVFKKTLQIVKKVQTVKHYTEGFIDFCNY